VGQQKSRILFGNFILDNSIFPMPKVKLFSGTNTLYLARKIALEYGKPLGELEIQKFCDGEMSPYYM
jgi:hypothetical protein